MPELRWTLLILGALFVAVLAWWEMRRQRQAPRPKTSHQNTSAPASSASAGHAAPGTGAPSVEGITDAGRVHREPTISFPELQPEPATELHAPVRREAAQDPRVVELDAGDFGELRVQGTAANELTSPDDPGTAALEVSQPRVISAWSVQAKEGVASDADDRAITAPSSATPAAQPPPQTPPAESGPAVGYVSDEESHGGESYPEGASAAGAPIVDWPGEQKRKIVALRLVSAPAARFLGRNVRMALAAEGFVLGKFDIFHKPGPDARAVLSAASLTKPGTFALSTIDGQRFGGLSLFAVLPGPLTPQETFDELMVTARNLNDRLQGALQDERGEPLTPMRSATIRDTLVIGNGSHTGADQPDGGSPQ
jgi:FtsZ-interacting cell division protein ZipA